MATEEDGWESDPEGHSIHVSVIMVGDVSNFFIYLSL